MRRLGPAAAAVAALLPAAVYLHDHLRRPWIGMDDANIFMVYARNLAGGHGLVFHPGGERVEGFTSFLYVLLLAPLFRLPAPELGALLLCGALAAAAVAVAAAAAGRLAGDRRSALPAQLAVALWCASSPSFVTWTALSLMDTALWACAWSACAWLSVVELGAARPGAGRRRAAAVLAAAVPLVRPEGVVLGPALAAVWALGARLRGDGGAATARAAAVPAAAWAASLAALTGFRLLYFGYPLPNTYYAKVPPDRLYALEQGADYLAGFLAGAPLAAAAAALAVLVLAVQLPGALRLLARGAGGAADGPTRLRMQALAAAVLVTGGLLLPVAVGGDHFAGFRFYQPLWPLFPLPAIALLRLRAPGVAAAPRARAPAWGLLLAALPLLWLAGPASWADFRREVRVLREFDLAESGRREGAALGRVLGAGTVPVGGLAVGGLAFAYPGPVIDLLGLNSVAMGHAPGERRGVHGHSAFHPPTFYALGPALLWPTYGRDPEPAERLRDFALARHWGVRMVRQLGLRGVVEEARFRERYVPAALVAPEDRPWLPDPVFFVPAGLPRPKVPKSLRTGREYLMGYLEPALVARLRRAGHEVLVVPWDEVPRLEPAVEPGS